MPVVEVVPQVVGHETAVADGTGRTWAGRCLPRVERDLEQELTGLVLQFPLERAAAGEAVGRGNAVDEPVLLPVPAPSVGFEQVRPPALSKLVGRLARVVVGHAVPHDERGVALDAERVAVGFQVVRGPAQLA